MEQIVMFVVLAVATAVLLADGVIAATRDTGGAATDRGPDHCQETIVGSMVDADHDSIRGGVGGRDAAAAAAGAARR
jgi:hypothetical protein